MTAAQVPALICDHAFFMSRSLEFPRGNFVKTKGNSSRKGQIMAKRKTFKVGRDAGTGKFITVKKAQQRKKTAVVETIKITKKK